MKTLKSTLAAQLTALRSGVGLLLSSGCNTRCKGCNTPSRHFFGLMGSAGNPIFTAINESADDPAQITDVSALNEALAAGDQEWTLIAPYRAIPNGVGLQVFDKTGADAMVSAFNSIAGKVTRLFRGLPVYVGHPDDPQWAKQNPTVRTEAVGRIKALEARGDGLYGKIAYNDEGKRLVSGEAAPYAFHSPRWGMKPITTQEGKKAFRPVLLHSIGLTNYPNIHDNAIGLNEVDPSSVIGPPSSLSSVALAKEDVLPAPSSLRAVGSGPEADSSPIMKSNVHALLAALGRPLAADSTVEQLAAAVNEAAPAATALAGAGAELAAAKPKLASAEQALASASNEIAALKVKVTAAEGQLSAATLAASNERSNRAEAVLVPAINEGRITEAQRAEWKGKLTTAPDFAVVEKEIAALKPAVNTKGKVAGLGARKVEISASNDTISAISNAVSQYIVDHKLDPATDYNRAFAAVKKAQPQLFDTSA